MRAQDTSRPGKPHCVEEPRHLPSRHAEARAAPVGPLRSRLISVLLSLSNGAASSDLLGGLSLSGWVLVSAVVAASLLGSESFHPALLLSGVAVLVGVLTGNAPAPDQTELERRWVEDAAGNFAAVFESSDDALVGVRLDGTIVSWNPGAERLYGYTTAEVVGRSVAVLLPADRAGELPQILERIRQGERIDLYETV